MKRIFVIFTCIILGSIQMTAATTPHDPGQINVLNSNIQKAGDQVQINFTLDYSNLEIASNDQLLVQPVLIGRLDTLRLPFLLFPGKTRDKANQRKMRLYGEEENYPLPVQTVYPVNGRPAIVDYQQEIPFENWMYGARLELLQEVYGCADCRRVLATLPLNYIENPPHVTFLIPFRDTIHEEYGVIYVHFPWDQSVIRPDFMDNTDELAKMQRSLDQIIRTNPGALNSIQLVGYASPEGTYAYNTRLANRRVEAIKDYIQDQYNVPETYFILATVPEDWDGVRQWAAASNLQHKDHVINIIDQTPNPDTRDNKIRRLDGSATYHRLLREAYPPLRRVEYRINYTAAPLSAEEAKTVWQQHPEQLTAYELYRVARTYPAGSPDFNEVILYTVQLYPDDVAANNNAAAVALSNGDLEEAWTYLHRIEDDPQAQNNLGVLLLKEGKIPDAVNCFQRAYECGCPNASYNLNYVIPTYNPY